MRHSPSNPVIAILGALPDDFAYGTQCEPGGHLHWPSSGDAPHHRHDPDRTARHARRDVPTNPEIRESHRAHEHEHLQELAAALNMPTSYFFRGAPSGDGQSGSSERN